MPDIREVALDPLKTTLVGSFDRDYHSLEALRVFDHHISHVFPHETERTVTFTAGNAINTYGDWAEIKDSTEVTFESQIISDTFIGALLIEDCSERDKVYMLEIAVGDAKTLITCYRFIAGETEKLPAVQQARIRSRIIRVGEKVYYRMKCETALATCQLHIRHYNR